MDEKTSLIQQSDKPLSTWYRRRVIIILVVVICTVLAFLAVATIAVSVTLVESSECPYNTPQDCLADGSGCDLWCFNSDGTGKCRKFGDFSGHSSAPQSCTPLIGYLCHAYGFASGQSRTSCVTFIPPGRNHMCKWEPNPNGEDCYYMNLGCCFDF